MSNLTVLRHCCSANLSLFSPSSWTSWFTYEAVMTRIKTMMSRCINFGVHTADSPTIFTSWERFQPSKKQKVRKRRKIERKIDQVLNNSTRRIISNGQVKQSERRWERQVKCWALIFGRNLRKLLTKSKAWNDNYRFKPQRNDQLRNSTRPKDTLRINSVHTCMWKNIRTTRIFTVQLRTATCFLLLSGVYDGG